MTTPGIHPPTLQHPNNHIATHYLPPVLPMQHPGNNLATLLQPPSNTPRHPSKNPGNYLAATKQHPYIHPV